MATLGKSVGWCATAGFLLAVFAPGSVFGAHPFLIVTESMYPDLQKRGENSPWTERRADAINTSNAGFGTISGSSYTRFRKCISATAVAYILDPPNRPIYKARVLEGIVNKLPLLNIGDTYSWEGVTRGGTCVLHAILALDIVYNALTAGEIGNAESVIGGLVATINPSGSWQEGRYGLHGTWNLYRGGGSSYKNEYFNFVVGNIAPDGVFKDGTSYAAWRYSEAYAASKHIYMDILEFTGTDQRYYSNQLLRDFHAWLYSNAVSPFRKAITFGDSIMTRTGFDDVDEALLRAGKFGPTAAGYAAWATTGGTVNTQGSIITYLIPDAPLPASVAPESAVYNDGGAWFRENTASPQSLMGVLWNRTASAFHSHKDVNAIYLAAYGEHVLVNSGYAGAGNGVDVDSDGTDECSWAWVNNTARSGNTLLVDGADHAGKTGAGLNKGFLQAGLLDFACGNDGPALPNDTHRRCLVFVHPQDQKSGYFVLVDRVETTPGKNVSIFLHPNTLASTGIAIATAKTSYRAAVDGYKVNNASNVHLNIFFTAEPTVVDLPSVNGCIAMENPRVGFKGAYLEARYSADSSGLFNTATILYPEDPSHPSPAMSRVLGGHAAGATIDHGGGIVDTVLGSDGTVSQSLGGVGFRARALVSRHVGSQLQFYFVEDGTEFSSGQSPAEGFASLDPVSIFMKGSSGRVQSAGTKVTLSRPGISGVFLDGQPETLLASGSGWAQIQVPAGVHSLEIQAGNNLSPQATFVMTPGNGVAPLAVSLDASASLDPDGAIIGWNWNLGADEGTANGQTTSHTYTVPGRYDVTLTVTDDQGASASSTQALSVSATTVFSPVPIYGDRRSYAEHDPSRWIVTQDQGDFRYLLATSAFEPLSGSRLGEWTVVPGKTLGNVELRVRARTPEDLGANTATDLCLILGYQDENNYYYAMFNHTADNSAVFLVKDGTRTELANARTNTIPDNSYHRYAFRRQDGGIEMLFDEQVVAGVANIVLGAGQVGVGSFNDSVYFDDIAVLPLPDPGDAASPADAGESTIGGGCTCEERTPGAGGAGRLGSLLAVLFGLAAARRRRFCRPRLKRD